jgi:hypothetical protein
VIRVLMRRFDMRMAVLSATAREVATYVALKGTLQNQRLGHFHGIEFKSVWEEGLELDWGLVKLSLFG